MLYTVCTCQVNIQYSSILSRSRDVFTLMFLVAVKPKTNSSACNSVSIVFNSSHRLFLLYFFLPYLTHNMHVNWKSRKKNLQLHKFLFIKYTLFQCNTVFSAVNTYGCRRQWLTEKERKEKKKHWKCKCFMCVFVWCIRYISMCYSWNRE